MIKRPQKGDIILVKRLASATPYTAIVTVSAGDTTDDLGVIEDRDVDYYDHEYAGILPERPDNVTGLFRELRTKIFCYDRGNGDQQMMLTTRHGKLWRYKNASTV
jgi:hypothetical protein